MNGKFQEREIGGLKVIELPGDPNRGTIVLLHGFGADATDLASLSNVYPGPTWIFPQGPLQIQFAPGFTGRAWFHVDIPLLSRAIHENRLDEMARAFPPDLTEPRSILDNFLLELNIPRSKIILGGFSQGAMVATETVLKSSDRFGGLVIFSGTMIEAFNWEKGAPHHATMPFFQSHGSGDPLLPLKPAEDLAKLLIDSGLKGKLHTFHGGHEIPHSILLQFSSFLKSFV